MNDLQTQLQRMAEFLHLDKLSPEHLKCIMDNRTGHFKREKSQENEEKEKDLFSAKQTATIEANVKEIKRLILQRFNININI